MSTRSASIVVGFIFLIVLGLGIKYWSESEMREAPAVVRDAPVGNQATTKETNRSVEVEANDARWAEPITQAKERVTKKPFGILIEPKTSPVQPERFRGIHTGTDFEIFPGEENVAILVFSICQGNIVDKRRASGYGGLVVVRCLVDDEQFFVIYGHLALSTVAAEVGETILAGEKLGELGAGGSPDTDGERKHLHLGLHRGRSVDIRGYVSSVTELGQWLDPCQFVCKR